MAIKTKESSIGNLVDKMAQKLLGGSDQPSAVVNPSSDATAVSPETPKDDGPATDGQTPSTMRFAAEPPKAVVDKPETPPVTDTKSGETPETVRKPDETSNGDVAEQKSARPPTSDPPSNDDQKPSESTGQKPDGESHADENSFSSAPESPTESTDRKPVESSNIEEESVEPPSSESKSD